MFGSIITNIDWDLELNLSIKLLTAFLFGGIIGLEREKSGNHAGVRTFGLISMGACAFGLLSAYVDSHEVGRIAPQVASGIGFIGAGVIFKENGFVRGLTTAATLWCTAAVGLSVSFNLYSIGFLSSFIILIFLSLKRSKLWLKISKK